MEAAVVVRSRRRRIRLILLGSVIMIAAISGVAVLYAVFYLSRPPKDLDCASASRIATYGVAITLCQQEYARTGDPAIGALLADALKRNNDAEGARALANGLLATEASADAFRILGEIAIDERRTDAATELLRKARRLHREKNQRAGVARDDLALSEIQGGAVRFTEALHTLDECVEEARAASDAPVEGLCHLAAAHVLSLVGHADGARGELDRAELLLSRDRELTKLWLERANIAQDESRGREHRIHESEALADLERALEHAQRAQLSEYALSIELNFAYSQAELGRLTEAELHLEKAAMLDHDKRYQSDRAQLAARIAYHRGDLALASSQNEKLYPGILDDNDRLEVCVMQARIELKRKNLESAEKWARRGVEVAEKVRAAQTAVELRPWVLASRRAPYELLFSVLVRAGRFEDAVVVFDQWQGRTLLDSLARSSADPSLGLAGTANKIQPAVSWLPVVSKAPLMTADRRAVVEALHTIDLFGLVVAEDELWRLTASRGRIRIDDLGRLDALQDRLDRFLTSSTDPALSGELGELLVPAELFGGTSTLHVVLDAKLALLPVVALRRGSRALIAARPVLRVPRLPDGATCVAPGTSGGAKVLADARGDLPDARSESHRAAKLLHTEAFVGDKATSAALFAAKSDSVLHVAVHAGIDAGGGTLELHDRTVSALEISAAQIGPPLVVLAGCSTADSNDPELAGSLATAFLASGSSQVVATLRPVADADTLELMSRFYDEGGTNDPVRKLAAIQAKLAEGDTKDWPLFAVFGSDCAPSR